MSSGVNRWSECSKAQTFSLSFGLSNITCQHNKLTPFTWQCSVDCGRGTQVRSVFCAGVDKGKYQEFPDEACPRSSKPASVQPCSSRVSCKPQWFTTKWGQVQWTHTLSLMLLKRTIERIQNLAPGIRQPWRAIQNPRQFGLPSLHRANHVTAKDCLYHCSSIR